MRTILAQIDVYGISQHTGKFNRHFCF